MVRTHERSGTSRRSHRAGGTVATTMRCLPVNDTEFVEAVDRVVAEMAASGDPEPRLVEARLRAVYPRVRVVTRQVIVAGASPGTAQLRWYAFRDGAAPHAPLDFE